MNTGFSRTVFRRHSAKRSHYRTRRKGFESWQQEEREQSKRIGHQFVRSRGVPDETNCVGANFKLTLAQRRKAAIQAGVKNFHLCLCFTTTPADMVCYLSCFCNSRLQQSAHGVICIFETVLICCFQLNPQWKVELGCCEDLSAQGQVSFQVFVYSLSPCTVFV